MTPATPVLSNGAVWVGLAAPLVMVLAIVNDVPHFRAPLPTWQSVIATATLGLAIAGPIAAAGVAVGVATARQWVSTSGSLPARPVWARVAQRAWPAGLGLLVGTAVCVTLIASGTRPDSAGESMFPTLLTVAAAVAVPLLAGALVGSIVTAVIAGPSVLIGGYAMSALGLVEPMLSWLGMLAGTWLPHAVRSLDHAVAPGLFAAPLAAFGVLSASLVSLGLRTRIRRGAAMLVVWVVGAGVLAAPLMETQPPGAIARPTADLRCVEVGLEVCLWPELEPNRESLTARLNEFAGTLSAADLPLPTSITPAPVTPTALGLSPLPDDDSGTTALQFSESYVRSLACIDPTGTAPIAAGAPRSMESIMAMHVASGNLAVALGADPARAATLSGWTPESGVTPSGHLGVDSRQAALAAFVGWADGLPMSCGVADAH